LDARFTRSTPGRECDLPAMLEWSAHGADTRTKYEPALRRLSFQLRYG
jgi:hypothetical protein